MNYSKLREEPLKTAVFKDFFSDYDYTQIGNIDFVISASPRHYGEGKDGLPSRGEVVSNVKSLLWAEAKQGKSHDIFESFVQLILTIGKEKTFEKYLPPKYIGAFDAEKFAFIEYHSIQEVFYQNDFNWNVAPSNHETKEFKQLHALCEKQLSENSILFKYASNSKELQKFIKLNFKSVESDSVKISVTKNNFVFVFQKWCESVKDSIAVDWEKAQKSGIIPADFFLADLLSSENESLKENLFVVLKKTKYELAKRIDDMGFLTSMSVGFLDNQRDHRNFWAVYERPPKSEYWDYIIGRRDLLVPQDIRERKGSFFTPKIWVEKSQEYLSDVLGENWQDEYYIWDCCAGTGNLLNGLTNYRNVWASTLDKADVDVMIDRVNNGWNMFENHIFQFDFLNDDFDKLPEELRKIVSDEKKRKKLVIYINPPYAEAGDTKQLTGKGKNKTDVAVTQKTYSAYFDKIGIAGRELYAQFFMRIYCEIPGCILGEFSTLKILQAPNFEEFRCNFRAKLEKSFLVPAWTFDNVKGDFPIGFFVWNCGQQETFNSTIADVFDNSGQNLGTKTLLSNSKQPTLTDWMISTRNRNSSLMLGFNYSAANDMQHNNYNRIETKKELFPSPRGTVVTDKNIVETGIYFAVRHCIEATWLNDRDQFLYPNDGWKTDLEFQSDCLAFTLFHGQNRISSEHGENHWIPFTEQEIGCKKAFKTHFMSDFIRNFMSGKYPKDEEKQGIWALLEEDKSLAAAERCSDPQNLDTQRLEVEKWEEITIL
ncbi:hypothetical protein J5690_04070 [bacterium]|nr:hypothetical protein [bacterium]